MNYPLKQPTIDDEVQFAEGDSFRGINPEIWIDYAVKACLRDNRVKPEAFVNDVEALQILLCNEIEKDLNNQFNNDLKAHLERAEGSIARNLNSNEIAFVKFQHLIKLIRRRTIVEVALEL